MTLPVAASALVFGSEFGFGAAGLACGAELLGSPTELLPASRIVGVVGRGESADCRIGLTVAAASSAPSSAFGVGAWAAPASAWLFALLECCVPSSVVREPQPSAMLLAANVISVATAEREHILIITLRVPNLR
jgi:hypothetical protein